MSSCRATNANPPYGRELAKWATKMRDEAQRGVRIVALLPVSPSSGWWATLAEVASWNAILLRRRIAFGNGPCAALVPHEHEPTVERACGLAASQHPHTSMWEDDGHAYQAPPSRPSVQSVLVGLNVDVARVDLEGHLVGTRGRAFWFYQTGAVP